ncbi:MAG: RNA polymerase sigma factor [Cytophagales bacterium]|nr:RNA polymerase sigma factor [Cytophagales bacterium]
MEEKTNSLEAKAINIHVDLIERAKGNDQEAQFSLYKKYNGAMYNTALRITHNTALAEDVLQESFLNAFQSLGYYRGDASFGSWLKRIVINKAISLSKKESKWELRDDESSFEKMDIPEESIEYNVENVKEAIEKLPDGFRTVISLYLLEGYDHREISEILQISESTSKTQYKRAKDKLRSVLIEEVNYG